MKQNNGRRSFLKKTMSVTFGITIIPRFVLGGPGYTAPSDQLTRAIIGVGGMGKGHIHYTDARLLAVCDVDQTHLKEALKIAGSVTTDNRF